MKKQQLGDSNSDGKLDDGWFCRDRSALKTPACPSL
jgi:hypothetical protein